MDIFDGAAKWERSILEGLHYRPDGHDTGICRRHRRRSDQRQRKTGTLRRRPVLRLPRLARLRRDQDVGGWLRNLGLDSMRRHSATTPSTRRSAEPDGRGGQAGSGPRTSGSGLRADWFKAPEPHGHRRLWTLRPRLHPLLASAPAFRDVCDPNGLDRRDIGKNAALPAARSSGAIPQSLVHRPWISRAATWPYRVLANNAPNRPRCSQM